MSRGIVTSREIVRLIAAKIRAQPQNFSGFFISRKKNREHTGNLLSRNISEKYELSNIKLQYLGRFSGGKYRLICD